MPQARQSESSGTQSEPREGEPPAPPEELKYSRDATHSTYQRADVQKEGEINPPPGPQTQQVLGKPTEASE